MTCRPSASLSMSPLPRRWPEDSSGQATAFTTLGVPGTAADSTSRIPSLELLIRLPATALNLARRIETTSRRLRLRRRPDTRAGRAHALTALGVPGKSANSADGISCLQLGGRLPSAALDFATRVRTRPRHLGGYRSRRIGRQLPRPEQLPGLGHACAALGVPPASADTTDGQAGPKVFY